MLQRLRWQLGGIAKFLLRLQILITLILYWRKELGGGSNRQTQKTRYPQYSLSDIGLAFHLLIKHGQLMVEHGSTSPVRGAR